MRGIFINTEDKMYVTYLVESCESDAVEYKRVDIFDEEEYLDIESGTVVDFSIVTKERDGLFFSHALVNKVIE